jgi:hypothetical protein
MSIDTITFEIDDYTLQLVDDEVLIWKGPPQGEADITIGLSDLRNALSTASMLIKA